MQKTPLAYRLKLIISGQSVEWFEYEVIPKLSFTTIKTKSNINYIQKNLNNTKKKLIRLVNNNPYLNKFLTLTFETPLTDLTTTNKLLKQFIQKLNYRYPNLNYIAVPELQLKRGIKFNISPPIHYHLLTDLPFVRQAYLQKLWSHGIIDIRRISHLQNVGLYLSKYLTKDLLKQKSKKKYLCSKNIKKPTILYDDFALRYLITEKPRFIYDSTYFHPFLGTIKFAQYLKKN